MHKSGGGSWPISFVLYDAFFVRWGMLTLPPLPKKHAANKEIHLWGSLTLSEREEKQTRAWRRGLFCIPPLPSLGNSGLCKRNKQFAFWWDFHKKTYRKKIGCSPLLLFDVGGGKLSQIGEKRAVKKNARRTRKIQIGGGIRSEPREPRFWSLSANQESSPALVNTFLLAKIAWEFISENAWLCNFTVRGSKGFLVILVI